MPPPQVKCICNGNKMDEEDDKDNDGMRGDGDVEADVASVASNDAIPQHHMSNTNEEEHVSNNTQQGMFIGEEGSMWGSETGEETSGETIRLWVDTSSTAMGARTTSVLKDLEHRNTCVGLAGNNLVLAGNGKLELQATAIQSRFSG